MTDYASSEEALAVLYCERGIDPDVFYQITLLFDTVIGNKQWFSLATFTNNYLKINTKNFWEHGG